MASYTWTGATSDSLTTTTNYTPNGTPTNTDSIYFPKDVTNAPATNMDGLGDTLALIHVGAGVSYNIGSSGNELQMKCAKIVHLGRAELWYDCDSNTADHDIILAPGAGGSSNILLSTSTAAGQIYCLSGKVSITGVGATDLIVVGGISGREALVTIGSGVGITTNLVQYAGSCMSSNNIVRLALSGGRHEKLNTEEADTVVQTGGVMVYDATDTVDRYEGMGGTVDFTRAGKALTVTTFVEGPGLRVVRSPDLTTFTTYLRVSEQL